MIHKSAPTIQLRNVAFEITNQCNIHCKICDHPLLAKINKPLSTDIITQAINDAVELGAREVTISGGEPLLHRGLDEIIETAKKARVQTTLISNGTLLSRSRIEKLISSGVNRFVISMNGLEKTDDYIRGKGVHSRSLAAINDLINSGNAARLVVNVTVCRSNIDELQTFVLSLKNLGVRRVTYSIFSTDFLIQDVIEKHAEFSLSGDQIANARNPLSYKREFDRNHIFNGCVVEIDGSVSPCWGYKGNFRLQDMSLKDIINSKEYLSYIQSLDMCENCFKLACYNK